jgi:hypothetical protein
VQNQAPERPTLSKVTKFFRSPQRFCYFDVLIKIFRSIFFNQFPDRDHCQMLLFCELIGYCISFDPAIVNPELIIQTKNPNRATGIRKDAG